jgi:hypothetical protein
MSVKQDLLGDLKLRRDDSNTSSGDRGLVPHLKEAVEMWKGQRNSLLLLRDTILGAQSSTNSCVDL